MIKLVFITYKNKNYISGEGIAPNNNNSLKSADSGKRERLDFICTFRRIDCLFSFVFVDIC